MVIFFTAFLKFIIGIHTLGVFLEIVHHRMTYSVRECGLFPEKYVVGEQIALEGMAEKVFSFVIFVHFKLGINAHDVLGKVKISERNPCLKGVYRYTSVGAENVVHIKLVYPLFGLGLEFFGAGGEIRIFIAKEFVGYFAGEQDTDVRMLVDILADQIHSHARPYGSDIVCSDGRDNGLKGIDNIIPCYDYFRMVAADVVGDFSGVFKVNSILIHSDGERLNGLFKYSG